MSNVDREYLDGLKRELRDATDPEAKDKIQAEIRRVGSGDAPSEPSEVEKAADARPVADSPKSAARPVKQNVNGK